ncbi:MAG: DEAD/DEAH box helicase [Candidatus Nitrohelix vancouverensis]|uniref:DEAD/DEAH box helicase n=1 Tax=Candidatus Nitrohelix vancouverensis TaxID=2705534 RepID=A0A7T0G3H6_9BACT|nr:MAG: DEAD/DEAH box helicase [Candidatus Nitrohelix vancouverensis]
MSLIEFESLPLQQTVLDGIKHAGFEHCTPIQAKSLPISLQGKDVAGQAQTGTGKTAAFLITTLNRLLEQPAPKRPKGYVGPRGLIIAPTRELAMQIYKDALLLGKFCDLRIVCVYGGVDYEKQKKDIQAGVDILIATPGRLIDYYKQKFFSLKSVQVLVIDEADRMFDMGFILDLRYILRNTPPYDQRLSMLFSATLNYRVLELCYEHMNNPEKVQIEPEKTVVDKIEQSLYHVGLHEKFSLLLGLLKREAGEKVLIFCNTKVWAEKLEFKLKHNDYNALQISGDLHQNKRTKVLEQFQSGDLDILIATDVASRGLHVDNITHVINYDLPQDPEDYVHRIGRTARAGAKGTAIALCCENFALNLERLEDYLKNKIPVVWPEEELFLTEKPGGEPPRRPRPKSRSQGNSGRSRSGSGGKSSRSGGRPSSRRPRR